MVYSSRVHVARRSRVRRILGPLAASLGVRFFDVFYGERRIDEVPPLVDAPVALEVRIASEDDVREIVAHLAPDDGARAVAAYAAGDVCVVAKAEDAVAGFIWASLARVELLGVPICTLPARGAYVHLAHVFPGYRGKKVLQVLGRALHLELRDRGCAFTCRLIDRDNAPSLIGTERGGVHYRWAPVVKLPVLPAFFLPPRPPALRATRCTR